MSDNNLFFWGNGSRFDVKLSMEDFLEIVDTCNDERLSREGILKFKNL